MLNNPIFTIGTERSGSNLLRLLLNAHSRIAIPHPPHVMRDFAPLLPLYGDLESDENFEALADDFAATVNLHFAPWPMKIDAKKLVEKAAARSLYGLYVALYETYREPTGKPRWGCKSTFMYREIPEIVKHHKDPRFLHLIRDPRDVAASAEVSIFSGYHPLRVAELWRREHTEIEAQIARFDLNILRIRYEDLVTDPKANLRKIMSYLGEEFEPGQLLFHLRSESLDLSGRSESWSACALPISNRSVGRYKKCLNERAIAQVESVAGALMERYGYQLEAPPALLRPRNWRSHLEVEVGEVHRLLRAELRAAFIDRNFLQRWRRRCFLEYIRCRRRFL